VQPDGGLPGAGGALHADRRLQVGPDQLVLLGLDGGHDVAHRAHPGALDLLGQDAAGGAQLLAPAQVLILEAGERPGGEAEPSPDGHALRILGAGPVERAGHRRPPVQHHRLAGVVDDVPAPDVVAVSGVVGGLAAEVQPAEEQRRGRVVRQLGDPAGERTAQRLGGERVAGDVLPGGEQRLGAGPHPGQGGAGRREVGPLGAELGGQRGLGLVGGQGHPTNLSGTGIG
jgi:hypothetical protein